MKNKRIISCLDIYNGNLAKSVKFVDTVELGDPVEVAARYCAQGIDELALYDITASHEGRGIMLDVVKRVAKAIDVPFSVGGGIASVEDCEAVLAAGATKANINSAAVKRPELIAEAAAAIGSDRLVLAMDVLEVPVTDTIPSGFELVINGGHTRTGLDAVAWAKRGEEMGAGEIVLNSIDGDGTREGFHIPLTHAVSSAVSIPVIASGGGGTPEHMYEALTEGGADGALVASILHYGTYTVQQIKDYLRGKGLPIQ